MSNGEFRKKSITPKSYSNHLINAFVSYKKSIKTLRFKESLAIKRIQNGNSNVGRPRLDDKIVDRVLELHCQGNSLRQIADRTNASKSSIARIINRFREDANEKG